MANKINEIPNNFNTYKLMLSLTFNTTSDVDKVYTVTICTALL